MPLMSPLIQRLTIVLFLLLSLGCESEIEIDFPNQDQMSYLYPVGIHDSGVNGTERLIISRYNRKPIIIFLPSGSGPHPVVLFQHGRPFDMPANYPYFPPYEFVQATIDNGFALAVSIRSGYFGNVFSDGEKVPCNKPKLSDFKRAAASASEDIVDAHSYLKNLSFIDSNNIVLAGSSAGGFASIASLPELDHQVTTVISINGGRCGKRGKSIGGLKHIRKFYEEVANETTTPVHFLAGGEDDVIPAYSTVKLYKSFCEARNDCAEKMNVSLIKQPSGNHNINTMLSSYSKVLN